MRFVTIKYLRRKQTPVNSPITKFPPAWSKAIKVCKMALAGGKILKGIFLSLVLYADKS